ncbi:Uncharacterised protein r2_g1026 [Pycnogonum litorale]
MAPERKQISLSQKAEIVQKYRSGVKQSKLAEDYGLAKTTINTIESKETRSWPNMKGTGLKKTENVCVQPPIQNWNWHFSNGFSKSGRRMFL